MSELAARARHCCVRGFLAGRGLPALPPTHGVVEAVVSPPRRFTETPYNY